MIRYYCPDCHAPLEVDDTKAGRAYDCPLCERTTLVPNPEDPPASVASGGQKAARRFRVPRRVAILGSLLVLVLLPVGYLQAPYQALFAIRSAALAGDRDWLRRLIDFPAVRASVKEQLKASFTRNLLNDPDMRNNPFAAMGMSMASGMVDSFVDTIMSPDGIANMVQGDNPVGHSHKPSSKSDRPRLRERYETLSRRVLWVDDGSDGLNSLRFVFTMHGLHWQMSDIRLPKLPPVVPSTSPATSGQQSDQQQRAADFQRQLQAEQEPVLQQRREQQAREEAQRKEARFAIKPGWTVRQVFRECGRPDHIQLMETTKGTSGYLYYGSAQVCIEDGYVTAVNIEAHVPEDRR